MSAAEDELGAERQERHRLAIMAASAPLLLVAATVFLPFFDERSPLEEAGWNPVRIAVLAFLFGWPVLLSAIGLQRGLARRAPGKTAYSVPAVLNLLAGIGLTLLLLRVLGEQGRAREEPGTWIALLAATSMVYVLGRGFRRSGWERWAQLVVGSWLTLASLTAVFASDRHGPIGMLTSGMFVFVFALSAAAPAVVWILWPKRRG